MQKSINRYQRKLSAFSIALLCSALSTSIAQTAPLSFGDLNGKQHTLTDKGTRATVLIFVARDCPISNTYAPELNRIAAHYAKNVRFFLVYPDKDLSAEKARQHAKSFAYQMPLVLDTKHRLVRATGATVTPQVAVLAADGKRVYLGRINNLYIGFGKKRARITQNDLRETLDAVLANKPVPHSTTTAIGCFIPESEN